MIGSEHGRRELSAEKREASEQGISPRVASKQEFRGRGGHLRRRTGRSIPVPVGEASSKESRWCPWSVLGSVDAPEIEKALGDLTIGCEIPHENEMALFTGRADLGVSTVVSGRVMLEKWRICSERSLRAPRLSKDRAAELELVLANAVCKKPVVAYALESTRQDVKQEPADEFVSAESHLTLRVSMRVVLPAKSDSAVVHRNKPLVRDGHAVRVPREVLEDLLGAAEGRL